jgi:hypothetical protein
VPVVNVYDNNGEVTQVLNLPEYLTPVSGRVSKSDSGAYYKGAGVSYSYQLAIKPDPSYTVVEKSDVFYCGYVVRNPKFEGKVGIFQDKYQPYFSDFIGTCGPKELKLIKNAREFDRAGVSLLDYVEHDTENHQYYFVLDYVCDRRKFLPDGDTRDLLDLLYFMVQEGWNLPWDKTSINDISEGGMVFDVADMFKSKHLVHKLGTVYSVFYSLARMDRLKYLELLHCIGLTEEHSDDTYTVLAAMRFLTDIGVSYYDLIPPELEEDNDKLRWFMLGNVLAQGRNCAHQEFPEMGETARISYRDRIFSNDNIKDLRMDIYDLGLGKVCLE